MNIHIPLTDDELFKELMELEACLPWNIEDMPVGWPYPQVAQLLTPHTYVVPAQSARVH